MNIPENIVVRPSTPPIYLKFTEVTRGDNKGAQFIEIDWEKTSVEDTYQAWSKEDIQEWIKIKFRQLTRALTVEATAEDTGVLDWDLFVKMFTGLSARGEKLADIVERYMEVTAQAATKMEAATAENVDPAQAAVLIKEATDLLKLGKKLKSDMEHKRREKEAKKAEKAAEGAQTGAVNA